MSITESAAHPFGSKVKALRSTKLILVVENLAMTIGGVNETVCILSYFAVCIDVKVNARVTSFVTAIN